MLVVPFLDDTGFLSLIGKYEPTDAELKLKPIPQKVTLHKRVTASQDLVSLSVLCPRLDLYFNLGRGSQRNNRRRFE